MDVFSAWEEISHRDGVQEAAILVKVCRRATIDFLESTPKRVGNGGVSIVPSEHRKSAYEWLFSPVETFGDLQSICSYFGTDVGAMRLLIMEAALEHEQITLDDYSAASRSVSSTEERES